MAETGEEVPGGRDAPAHGTMAEKLTWLLQHAHPAGTGPLSTHQASELVEKATGEKVSHQTIWKICQGMHANPSVRVIQALARTFGVPTAYLIGELGEKEADRVQEQVEVLAMIRDADIDTAQLRMILSATPGVRQAIIDLIRQTTQAEAGRSQKSR